MMYMYVCAVPTFYALMFNQRFGIRLSLVV